MRFDRFHREAFLNFFSILAEEDNALIPPGISNDCIAQSWYRFVRMIGSPTALCCPQVISHTPQFMQYILLRDDSIEPHQHPCLLMLPQIFLKAMKGIASQVDAFLGELVEALNHNIAAS